MGFSGDPMPDHRYRTPRASDALAVGCPSQANAALGARPFVAGLDKLMIACRRMTCGVPEAVIGRAREPRVCVRWLQSGEKGARRGLPRSEGR